MISRWLPLALCVVVFAPGLLYAQQPTSQPSQPTSQPSSQDLFSNAVRPTNYDKMYEDVEILRRILDSKLRPYLNVPNEVYRFSGLSAPSGNDKIWIDLSANTMTASNGVKYKMLTARPLFDLTGRINTISEGSVIVNPRSSHRVFPPRIEGVYLKGQGVIYTATLPSLQLPAAAEVAGSAKKAMLEEAMLELAQSPSEWESVRRHVRNEKEEPKKPEATKPPELSDVLLRTLMENGEHFSQLGANESLTIVITVRETSPSSSGPKSEEQPSIKPPMTRELATKLRDLELLADLHLKQAEYKEALEEYTKTLELDPSAELHRKLAQCYLGLNQMEQARTELDRAIEFSKKSQDAKDKPKPVATLPVKLIVSASKKLLDEAKGGKIPFEELRRKAHVETLKFDAPRR